MNKRKIRFNIIDFIIIVFVLVTASFLIKTYIADDTEAEEKNTVSLNYVIESDMLAESFSDNVEPGESVYDKATGRLIGTVVSCDVRSATHTGFSDEGAQVLSDIAGYRVLYITIEAQADGNAGSYSVENVPISAGEEYELMFKNLYCTGSCISVEVIG